MSLTTLAHSRIIGLMGRNAKIALIVAIVAGAAVFFGAGLVTGRVSSKPDFPKTPLPKETPNQAETIFTTQQATVLGKITGVNGKKITVENIFTKKGELELSDNVTIFKFDPKSKSSSPSSDLNDIRLNGEVIINLVLMDGKYYVVTIANRPPDPSIPEAPQAASPASKLRKQDF